MVRDRLHNHNLAAKPARNFVLDSIRAYAYSEYSCITIFSLKSVCCRDFIGLNGHVNVQCIIRTHTTASDHCLLSVYFD